MFSNHTHTGGIWGSSGNSFFCLICILKKKKNIRAQSSPQTTPQWNRGRANMCSHITVAYSYYSPWVFWGHVFVGPAAAAPYPYSEGHKHIITQSFSINSLLCTSYNLLTLRILCSSTECCCLSWKKWKFSMRWILNEFLQ